MRHPLAGAPHVRRHAIGPRGGHINGHCTVVRANGACKTWKRDPERFSLPIKYGMYEFSTIDNANAHLFHTADDCECHPGLTYSKKES